MSNFADIAYDNYLMHYRTKGSKNGYTKDPDYTPVGEKARDDYAGMPSSAGEAKEKAARSSEISRLSNQFGRKGHTGGMPSSDLEARSKAQLESFRRKREEQEKRDEEISKITKNPFLRAYREDYSGMPTSAKDAALDAYRKTLEKRATRKEAAKSYARSVEINKLSKQKTRGDYAGMPSSVKEAQARAKEEKRDRMKSKAEAKRKSEYMKAKAEAKRKKESEINRLSEQASRGDLGGMPSSARSGNAYVQKRLAFKEWARKEREKDARERARRNLQIDKLSRQKSRGDYAGMPSSAMKAKEKAEEEKFWKKYEKASGEKEKTKRKKESEKDEKGQTSKTTKESPKGWWSEQMALLKKWGIPTDEAYLEKQGIKRYSHSSKRRKV